MPKGKSKTSNSIFVFKVALTGRKTFWRRIAAEGMESPRAKQARGHASGAPQYKRKRRREWPALDRGCDPRWGC